MGMTDEQAQARLDSESKTNSALQKQTARAEAAERAARAAAADRERAEKELRASKAAEGRRAIAAEREDAERELHPAAKSRKKVKRDKDGFAVFEG